MTVVAITRPLIQSSIESQDAICRQRERISRLAAGVEAVGTLMYLHENADSGMGEKAQRDIGLLLLESGQIIRESLAEIENLEQQIELSREGAE